MDIKEETTTMTRLKLFGMALLCTVLAGQKTWAASDESLDIVQQDTITQPQGRINVLRYSMLSHYKPDNQEFTGRGFRGLLNHAFVQFGYDTGIQAPIGSLDYIVGHGVHGSIGGDVSPHWAFRLHGGYSFIEEKRNLDNLHSAFMRVDAMFNATSWLQGYRSDRQWNVYPYAGLGVSASYHHKNLRFGPTAESGLEIRTRMSRYGHIYVAPYLAASRSKIEYEDNRNWRDYDINAGLRVGVLYYIHNKDVGDEGMFNVIGHALDNTFVELITGQSRWKYEGHKDWNSFTQINVGKWINPYFGVKAGVALGAGYWGQIEGLVNPITLLFGVPDESTPTDPMLEDLRRFHLNLSAGLIAGYSDRQGETINVKRPMNGWTASVQGLYDLTSNCSVFVAPRVVGDYGWNKKDRKVTSYSDLQFQIQFGLRFNLDY